MIIDNVSSSVITVYEHENATLICQARGRPIPFVAWLRQNEDKKDSPNQTQIEKTILANDTNGLFNMINVNRNQSGFYECRVSNGVNDHVLSKSIELRVLCKSKRLINDP